MFLEKEALKQSLVEMLLEKEIFEMKFGRNVVGEGTFEVQKYAKAMLMTVMMATKEKRKKKQKTS